MGYPKSRAIVAGKSLTVRAVDYANTQTTGPILLAGDTQHIEPNEDAEIITDKLSGQLGPLAGIYSALEWANENAFDRVGVIPIDMPTLPKDLFAKLNEISPPTYAKCGERVYPVCSVWMSKAAPLLKDQLEAGTRSVRDWIRLVQAKPVEFDQPNNFMNINTPEELERATDQLSALKL